MSVRSHMVILLGAVFLGLFAFCMTEAQAVTVTIPNVAGKSVKSGIESWRYVGGNQNGTGCFVSKGTRKDTVKITRTIQYLMRGNKNNVQLNIEKQVILKYEVFSSGPQKGRVYRMYKPTMHVVLKECKYLRVFRLTTHAKSALLEYGLGFKGDGVAQFEESTYFTLPQQFPFRRDAFTEFLRRLFRVDFKTSQKEYVIAPGSAYGSVSVVLR